MINDSRGNIRRYQNRRNAHAEPREIKRGILGNAIIDPGLSVRIYCRWRGNVVVGASVFIIDDDKESGISNFGIAPNRFERSLDQGLSLSHVVVGMLVACGKGRLPIASGRIREAWFQKTIGRQIVIGACGKKIV